MFNKLGLKGLSLMMLLILIACGQIQEQSVKQVTTEQIATQIIESSKKNNTVSAEEKKALQNRFEPLLKVNKEVIGYIYAPGTMLDEPIVQTTDNEYYLKYTIDRQFDPYMGTVFMDDKNDKDFSNELTWLFGHARGSQVPDHRMFNDVNFYDNQSYFDEHPYVVIETPEGKRYYEAAFLIIVPETTAFYKTSFTSKADFKKQLIDVSEGARTKNKTIKIDETDHYVVLSTCREEDPTIRSNLYLRQIPDDELPAFLEEHGDELTYKVTR